MSACCYACDGRGWTELDEPTCGDLWCSCHDHEATGGAPLSGHEE